MSIATCINIVNVCVLDNPTAFLNQFQFEVTFECLQELPDDLEWKVIYVGNAEDSLHDQVLEEVMVGPVPVGINRFVLTSNAPNPAEIANQDLLGVTVILITCSFMDNKFIQIGYYVNNEYSEPYDVENPPNPVDITKLYRNILSDQPRVTRFAIDWTGGAGPAVASEDVDQQQLLEGQEEQGEDLAEMEEDDDEDEEDDDEEEDDNAEVDLADQEDEDENDENDEEGDGEEADEEGTDDASSSLQRHYNGMEVHNEDSNSMDVARMLQ